MVKGLPYSYKYLPKIIRDSDNITLATLYSIISNAFPDIEISFYDETIEKINLEDINADIVGISAITPAYYRAKSYAEYFRNKNIPVFIGGVHATLVPEECSKDFDSVISGLANESLVQLISDFKQGNLKKIYYQNKNMSFENFVHPKRDLYKLKFANASEMAGIQATYGCSNICEFCVQPHICCGYHQRPVKDVISEIKEIKSDSIEFYDPNLAKDLNYLKELCTELEPLQKKWFAPMTITITENEEVLSMLKNSGCKRVLIGFESINTDSIKGIGKGFNNIKKYEEAVAKLHKYGIQVVGSFVLGLDGDDDSVEKNTLKFVRQAHIDFVRFTINTPYPGTDYYNKMKAQGRIITDDLSLYDCVHCVIQPENFTPEKLEKMQKRMWRKAYSFFNIIRRLLYRQSVAHFLLNLIINCITGVVYFNVNFKD